MKVSGGCRKLFSALALALASMEARDALSWHIALCCLSLGCAVLQLGGRPGLKVPGGLAHVSPARDGSAAAELEISCNELQHEKGAHHFSRLQRTDG